MSFSCSNSDSLKKKGAGTSRDLLKKSWDIWTSLVPGPQDPGTTGPQDHETTRPRDLQGLKVLSCSIPEESWWKAPPAPGFGITAFDEFFDAFK